MGMGVVSCTSNIDSIIQTFCLSECLDFGAGQRGSDNWSWTVLCAYCIMMQMQGAHAWGICVLHVHPTCMHSKADCKVGGCWVVWTHSGSPHDTLHLSIVAALLFSKAYEYCTLSVLECFPHHKQGLFMVQATQLESLVIKPEIPPPQM